MTAHTRLDPPLVESIRKALTGNALPGETHGLSRDAEREAAEFLAQVASRRKPGESRSRSSRLAASRPPADADRHRQRRHALPRRFGRQCDRRRGLIIHRLLHPVVCVERDDQGALHRVEPLCGDKDRRESMMYLEVDRADARGRQELAADLQPRARRRPRSRCAIGKRCRADARATPRDRRRGRRGAAQLVRRRRDDPARLSGRTAGRGAVRAPRHLQHPRRSDRRGRLRGRDALFRAGRRGAA